ncbi:hypothetical protein SISNIDRAFT_472483 [Sistotremastrum niveocremeum HHB9708]|uniref:RBR-type E3 ubiquitin transferase n=1 Tax=Sistotremastrum niveocremeum HHB9708 TaxID=1314777 RepID=A0A165A9K8_9AGAM|nr:hypothetical protein SISNIDRAFT_472483 [Sistotremastrum niveocremeum HHB9708]
MSDEEYMSDDYEYFDNDEDDMDVTQGDDGTSHSEDEAMDDAYPFNDDIKVSASKGKRKSYDIDYECLDTAELQATIKREADHITSIFGVDFDTAVSLLRHLGWNKERLIEKYMDSPNAVNSAAGIESPSAASPRSPGPIRSLTLSAHNPAPARRSSRRLGLSPTTTSAPQLPSNTCPICCDDEPEQMKGLSCDHTFCGNCWAYYITGKLRDEGESVIRCMASDCSLVAPETFIKEAVSPENYERYKELVVRDYVTRSASLKFCPAPSCVYAVSCSSAASKSALTTIVPTVTCQAGHAFCFGCSIESDHRPVICAVAKLWLKKCQDDSETANWIKSNTKECTKCQSTIEKNGGCNHMTCKKCKHEFCWVCMGPWVDHGTAWYSCNRYDDKAGVDARDAQSRSRASLERYLHYYNRWANHEQSAKLTVDLYAKTEKKMEEMQITSDLTWIEVQFAKKAVDEVSRCRMTLKWTYAMAYYLAKGNQKELFEDNQRDLEKAVEDLSELLETAIEPENIPTLRQKMTDKTVYVQKRNEILLEDTAKGFSEGRWHWNVEVEGFDNDGDLESY